MSIALGTGILNPAFRIAGITDRAMRSPSPDQYAEGITVLNRLIGSWNCDPLAIFAEAMATYTLTASKVYTIGPGGAGPNWFNGPRPQKINFANIILPGTPNVRKQMKIVEYFDWAEIEVQDIPGAIPRKLYCDYGDVGGLSTIYVYPQPAAGYLLELYARLSLLKFASVADTVILPDGYEKAIVYNLAVELAAQFTTQARLAPEAPAIADLALSRIQSLNAPVRTLSNDAMSIGSSGNRGGDWNWWRTGGQ